MKYVLTALVTAFAQVGFCQGSTSSSTVRYYLAYAEQRMVDYARTMGYDANAAIGEEIPHNVPVLVPHQGMADPTFKVSVGFQVVQTAANSPAIHFYNGVDMNLAFERAYCNAGAGDVAPDEYSFNKLTWGTDRAVDAFTYPSHPVYWFDTGLPIDLDGDGNIDSYPMKSQTSEFNPRFYRRGTEDMNYFNLSSVRPVGFAGSAMLLGAMHKVEMFEKRVLYTVNIRSHMLAGETYGDDEGETGLWPSTSPVLRTSSSNVVYFRNFTGAMGLPQPKYLVRAVPEPGALLALSAGVLALRRRRKYGDSLE